MREAGLAAYKAIGWFGLLAPVGTNRAIILRLSDSVREAAGSAEVIAGLRAQGIEPAANSPAEFASFIQEQLELHKKLTEEIDLKLAQ
jgi:tripartite-type tricarboxylate transporter receptor subunit TctC